MEFLQLQYFAHVAKHQSVSKAAEELRVSQPSLSSAIIRLEKELGVSLFERQKRKMILTTYGHYFLNTTQKILDLISDTRLVFEEQLFPRVSIAFQNYNEHIFSMMEDFRTQYPDIEFNVHGSVLSSPFPIEHFDFIIGNSKMNFSIAMNEMQVEPLNYYVVVPKSSPLAEQSSIHIMDLRGKPMGFLKNEHGGFELAYQFCLNNGFIPKCVFSTDNNYYKYRFLTRGTAFGLIPIGWADAYSRCPEIQVLPLEGFELLTNVMFYWPKDTPLSLSAQLFLDYIKENITKISKQ